jgi:hypothetical protein
MPIKILVVTLLVLCFNQLPACPSAGSKFKVADKKTVVEKDLERYRSFPSMVKIKADNILMAYRDAHSQPNVVSHGFKGDTKLTYFRNGRWSAPKILYQHEGELIEEMAGDLSILKDGTIFIASRQWNNEDNGKPHESYIAWSMDHGKTFTPRKVLRFAEFQKTWAPFGKIIELDDGTLLMGAYGTKKGDTRSSSGCIISKDHGENWQFLSWVAINNCIPGVEFNEIFILKLHSKKLFAILRTTNGFFYTTYSHDNGKTWELPQKSFEGMACAGLVLSSGEIMISYRGIRHAKDGNSQTGLLKKGNLYNFRVSADEGKTWSDEVEIDNGDVYQTGSYGMGDLVEMKNGNVKVVYYTSDKDQAPWLEECLLVKDK